MKRILTPVILAASMVVASAAIALAGQPGNHGAEVSAVAKAVENVIDGSHGKAVSAIARTHGAAVSAAARAKGEAHAAAKGDNAADAADASESGRLKAEAGTPS